MKYDADSLRYLEGLRILKVLENARYYIKVLKKYCSCAGKFDTVLAVQQDGLLIFSETEAAFSRIAFSQIGYVVDQECDCRE